MDKRLIAERFAKARNTYTAHALIQRLVAERMMDKLSGNRPDSPDVVVELGCGTGIYSRLLWHILKPSRLLLNDLCSGMEECLHDLLDGNPAVTFHPGDAECLNLPSNVDLITSCSAFQWFTDLPRFFDRCHRALSPGGILAFSTFGPDNLREIRRITGNGLHYPATEELCNQLSFNFHFIHAEEEIVPLTFDSPRHVLKHLKQTGITGTEKRMWTRSRLEAFNEAYIRLFGNAEGQVTLTYHPIYVLVQKE